MFEPWIGENYHSSAAPRTLILGESHYGDHHVTYGYDVKKKTILCIEDQIIRNRRYRFYTKLASTFIGHRPNQNDKKEFWHHVAYHNLITEPLDGPRRAPSETQWRESLTTLPSVVESLRPDYVVVLGKRMWYRIAQLPFMRDVTTIKEVGDCGVKIYNGCYFHGIKHPSGRSFRLAEWHGHIDSAKKQILVELEMKKKAGM